MLRPLDCKGFEQLNHIRLMMTAVTSIPSTTISTQPTFTQKITRATFFLTKSCVQLGYWSLLTAINPIKTLLQSKPPHNEQCDTLQKLFQNLYGTPKVGLEPKPTIHLFRPNAVKSLRLDMVEMDRILTIDEKHRTAHVQGLTTFETLLKATLALGLRPKVVPNLLTITVGGAIAGTAGESSSFKYGLFHESVLEMEVLVGTGQIITCNKNHCKNLFDAIPNSYGTLGYILSAKIELIPAQPFVALTYTKFDDLDAFLTALHNVCEEGVNDFVEGVVFSNSLMMLMCGTEVNTAPYTSNYIEGGVFYLEIQKKLSDHLSINDYFFRWDHDFFWSTQNTVFQKPWVRKTFGSFLLQSDRIYKLTTFLHQFHDHVVAPFSKIQDHREDIIQSVDIPWPTASNFIRWFQNQIGLFPILMHPIHKQKAFLPLWSPWHDNETYLNLSFYGSKITHGNPLHGHYNRLIEAKLQRVNGWKSLHNRLYYDEETFKLLYYNGDTYAKIKKIYDPTAKFPTLFEKCVT